MVKFIIASALLLSVVAMPVQAQVPTETKKETPKFDPKRDPDRDLAAAIKLATKENKRIMLDVGGEWCPWCHKLDKFFETNDEARKILKDKYVVVKINFSPENENKAFLGKYPKINGYPHLFVLDKSGKLLHSQDTGLLETGPAHDPAKVIPFLNKWAG
ncbi:MAG TPA: thioredoxin family protein [Fimbriimonadaceae bacterium]|nr:thioredoxin family protein [Fimbriimonadaceae bacterium]